MLDGFIHDQSPLTRLCEKRSPDEGEFSLYVKRKGWEVDYSGYRYNGELKHWQRQRREECYFIIHICSIKTILT